MTPPGLEALFKTVEATWPPASTTEHNGWTFRAGAGGGKRVSAATTQDETADLSEMVAGQRALGQDALVMVRGDQPQLDARLGYADYAIVDPTTVYIAPVEALVGDVPRVTAFEVMWPPLKIQHEIWAEGGIGPARIAIMDRAKGRKVALMGRVNDRPAGAAFIACDNDTAMLHALEVSPRLRRQGVAAHMMRAAALWAQDAGMAWLSVLVTQANTPANTLYRSLGMQPVGQYHYRAASTPAA